uniref:Uncharacterized protein n=1 Tax=Lepeophtheirus salmonis TaxID=72036 RepID=A0A0K2TC97_LEPSM
MNLFLSIDDFPFSNSCLTSCFWNLSPFSESLKALKIQILSVDYSRF